MSCARPFVISFARPALQKVKEKTKETVYSLFYSLPCRVLVGYWVCLLGVGCPCWVLGVLVGCRVYLLGISIFVAIECTCWVLGVLVAYLVYLNPLLLVTSL